MHLTGADIEKFLTLLIAKNRYSEKGVRMYRHEGKKLLDKYWNTQSEILLADIWCFEYP